MDKIRKQNKLNIDKLSNLRYNTLISKRIAFKLIIQLKKEEHKLKTDIKDLQNNKEFLENSLVQAKHKLSTMAKMMLNAV
jgi:hypothetical protein